MSSIKGQIRKNLFVGDNGYYVSLFKLASDNEALNLEKDSTITITGYFNELNFNDIYELHGSMIEHPKYGLQFKSDTYIRLKPEGKDAIIEFLSSELFPGIGEKTAANIAEQFKEKTFETIINNPEDLYLIPRLSQKNIDTLHQVLKDYESSYQILVDLAELGFNTKDAVKINNHFKDEIKEVLKTNLYKLLELKDLDFRKIDEIAIKNNYLIDDPRRVETVIIYALEEVCFSLGHSYLKHNELYNYSKRAAMYDMNFEQFEECLASNIENLLIIKEGDKYYLKEIYEAEEYVSTRINYLLNKKELEYSNINKSYEKMSLASSIKFNKSQKQAIIASQKQNFTVITGGPGTGKTTIVKAIIELYQIYNSSSFQKLHKEIALLSPTGRASKRLSEATLMPASTIHRFLRWNKENDSFQLNERNKSDAKLVIIDESSMIDITLLASLFKALRMDCRVIMVGDYEQLPSVGPGQILKDIIDTSLVPIVFLTELYRQASDSNIVKLAYGINTGAIDLTAQNDDLIFMDDSNILASISEIANKYKNVNYRDFQILVPIYKGAHGIDAINKIAQNIFNPASKNKKELSYFDKLYREGDKVLQLVNMPDENVYNGDLGLILNISPKEILIDFDGNLVSYSSADFKNFTLAYAISVHKAQGSEFKTVVLPASFAYHKMLYRKLYYTAVSRAKDTLYIVGDPRALKQASLNDKSDIRQTSLKDKLRNKFLI